MKIIGIGGTNGSGKDTLGAVVAEHFNSVFMSGSDLLREEAKRRGWAPDRLATRTISQEWRKQHGLAVLIDMMVRTHKGSSDSDKGLAIASLRNGGEPDRIHELGGVVVWVDAPVEVRYKRVASGNRAGRSVDDEKTLEQFMAEEKLEMYGKEGDEETALRTIDVKNKADIVIENDFTTLEEFTQHVVSKLERHL